MVVRCNADCKFCKNNECTADEIIMEDVEQNGNIKFLEKDYMACKTLKVREV